MKKTILMAAMILMATAAGAQRQAQDYFVKTKNAKEPAKVATQDSTAVEEEKARNLMNELFPRRSLCEWNDSMLFMVLPDKRDLVLRVFHDGFTNNPVSTMTLLHKLMRYQSHTRDNGTNRDRINFITEDSDRHPYYFEVPSGTFDDYCFTKYGVPALAYLNDVETARKVLLGKTLVTKTNAYWIDATYGEGADEIQVKIDTEVKVVKIGVGTRAFPVKIIVADKSGKEFYQNVAISRTNSGLRDEEFNMMDNQHHTFETAFDMMGDFALPSWHYDKYLNKTIFARRTVRMQDSRDNDFTFPGLTTFKIISIKSLRGKSSVKMTLQNKQNGTNYSMEVIFRDAPGDAAIKGKSNIIFENLFSEGNPANLKGVDPRHLGAIRQGKIQKGFTETEVLLVRDDDHEVVKANNRTYMWVFSSLYGKPSLNVVFDAHTKRVIHTTQAE